MTSRAIYPCPCCGYLTMPKLRGSFCICEVCLWEDDEVQAENPDFDGGANDPSLNDARENFLRYGVCDPELAGDERPPLPDEIPPGGAKGPATPPQ